MQTPPDFFSYPDRIPETERYQRLSRLDAYYRGTQYDGRPDWWTGTDSAGQPVPLRERKPCVIYPLPKAAVQQATRFTFGEGRFPGIKAEPVEAADALQAGLAVSEDEAEALTKGVAEIVRQTRLKSGARKMLAHALAVGTAPVIMNVRRGKFALDMPRACDCWPEFIDGDPTAEVARMVWCYQFEKTVEEGGRLKQQTHFFRRDIDAQSFTVYHDATREPGKPVEWRIDEERSDNHGLGFCPVIWYRNAPESDCSDVDGVSLYADCEDEFDALNFALSQRHRGVHYFGTPQAYETNVGEDENPAGPPVRTARPPKERKEDYGRDRDEYRHMADPFAVNPARPARRYAPDQIWSYKGEAELGVLETSGKAFEVATAHVSDIRSRILEAINVVLLDPSTIAGKGEMSAKALAILFSPLLALVDEIREEVWDCALERILQMVLRIIAARGAAGAKGTLLIPGIDRIAKLLQRFLVPFDGGTIWLPPRLTPAWGDYFSPSNKDIDDAVNSAEKAKSATLITAETATRYIAPYFGIDDPEQEAKDAEGDAPEDAQEALNAERMQLPPEEAPAEQEPPSAPEPAPDGEQPPEVT